MSSEVFQNPSVMGAIKASVVNFIGNNTRESDMIFELSKHTVTESGGVYEGKLVVAVKNTGRLYTFRISVDKQGKTVSVKLDAVHVMCDKGWSGGGKLTAAGGGGGGANREQVVKWVWVSIGVVLAVAVITGVSVFAVKRAKKKCTAMLE